MFLLGFGVRLPVRAWPLATGPSVQSGPRLDEPYGVYLARVLIVAVRGQEIQDGVCCRSEEGRAVGAAIPAFSRFQPAAGSVLCG
jgi:hypothetical protein